MKITKSKFDGIFWIENDKKKIATVNLIPGFAPFKEKLIDKYRRWDEYRSKWAAAIMRGIKEFPLKKGDKVLYLGAASGQSASYISDIVGDSGKVFCVEISPRVMRELIFVAEKYCPAIVGADPRVCPADNGQPQGVAPTFFYGFGDIFEPITDKSFIS